MEPNVSSISKKIWNLVKVAIFLIKKGINKKKIFMDLNMMMKRGKIAGKALRNIMCHNHHHHHNIHHFFTSRGGNVGGPSNDHPEDGPQGYEFSCSETPLYNHYFPKKRKNHQKNNIITQHYYIPSPIPLEESENINIEDINTMLDMMLRNEEATSGGDSGEISAASPLLSGLGFGQSPAVRQLRITDSPFPVQNTAEAKQVDQDAEDFIKKFYNQLKQQKF